MSRRKGRQVDLASSLERLVGRLDRAGGGYYLQSKVITAWDKIAGPAVASHTTGTHLRGGELVIYVDSNLWATELSALSEHYRESMNTELGKHLVRSVRFTVSRKAVEHRNEVLLAQQEQQADEARPVAPREPLSDVEIAQLEASVSVISDPELREAVLRATVADFERKKGLASTSGP